MNNPSHQLPRIAIQSIGGGLFLMAFFTMMWTGIAQAAIQGRDYRASLAVFSIFAAVFVFYGFRMFRYASRFPKFTTADDEIRGKKMSKAFAIIFGIEGTAIPVISGILIMLGYDLFILPGIALIVGLHFYPMASVFNRTIDYYLATWTCLVALVSILLVVTESSTQAFSQGLLGVGVALTTVTYGLFMIREGTRLTQGA